MMKGQWNEARAREWELIKDSEMKQEQESGIEERAVKWSKSKRVGIN